MKFFKLSGDDKFALLGEVENASDWYSVEPKIVRFIKSMSPGTEVNIRSKKIDNKNHLIFMQKFNGVYLTDQPKQEPPLPQTLTVSPEIPVTFNPIQSGKLESNVSQEPEKKKSFVPYSKSKEETDAIKAQSCGYMTSESLLALQGQVSVDNVDVVIRKIYATYKELVN